MPRIIEGDLLAADRRIGLVVSRFNDFLTGRLLNSACETYRRHGGDPDTLVAAWVPGSYELPLTARELAGSGRFEAVVCLGCVIRGGTDHYEHVAKACLEGIAQASLETSVPVLTGVITADTLEQAIDRAGAKQGNLGAKAMLGAIEMANLRRNLANWSGAETSGPRS